ncbi:MAG: hypothetical protein ACI8P9_004312 [Parasphingorhabdus sp.]
MKLKFLIKIVDHIFPTADFIESPLEGSSSFGLSKIKNPDASDIFLTVPERQKAFVRTNTGLVEFSSGLHNLAESEFPTNEGELPADVYFVGTGPVQIKKFEYQHQVTADAESDCPEFKVKAAIDVNISDIGKLTSLQSEHSVQDPTVFIREIVLQHLMQTLIPFVTSNSSHIERIMLLPRQIADLLAAHFSDSLAEAGLLLDKLRFSHFELIQKEHTVDALAIPETPAKDFSFELIDFKERTESDKTPSEDQGDPTFYIAVGRQQTGPFTHDGFIHAIDDGIVLPETFIWYPGLKEWQKAGTVPEFLSLFDTPQDED